MKNIKKPRIGNPNLVLGISDRWFNHLEYDHRTPIIVILFLLESSRQGLGLATKLCSFQALS